MADGRIGDLADDTPPETRSTRHGRLVLLGSPRWSLSDEQPPPLLAFPTPAARTTTATSRRGRFGTPSRPDPEVAALMARMRAPRAASARGADHLSRRAEMLSSHPIKQPVVADSSRHTAWPSKPSRPTTAHASRGVSATARRSAPRSQAPTHPVPRLVPQPRMGPASQIQPHQVNVGQICSEQEVRALVAAITRRAQDGFSQSELARVAASRRNEASLVDSTQAEAEVLHEMEWLRRQQHHDEHPESVELRRVARKFGSHRRLIYEVHVALTVLRSELIMALGATADEVRRRLTLASSHAQRCHWRPVARGVVASSLATHGAFKPSELGNVHASLVARATLGPSAAMAIQQDAKGLLKREQRRARGLPTLSNDADAALVHAVRQGRQGAAALILTAVEEERARILEAGWSSIRDKMRVISAVTAEATHAFDLLASWPVSLRTLDSVRLLAKDPLLQPSKILTESTALSDVRPNSAATSAQVLDEEFEEHRRRALEICEQMGQLVQVKEVVTRTVQDICCAVMGHAQRIERSRPTQQSHSSAAARATAQMAINKSATPLAQSLSTPFASALSANIVEGAVARAVQRAAVPEATAGECLGHVQSEAPKAIEVSAAKGLEEQEVVERSEAGCMTSATPLKCANAEQSISVIGATRRAEGKDVIPSELVIRASEYEKDQQMPTQDSTPVVQSEEEQQWLEQQERIRLEQEQQERIRLEQEQQERIRLKEKRKQEQIREEREVLAELDWLLEATGLAGHIQTVHDQLADLFAQAAESVGSFGGQEFEHSDRIDVVRGYIASFQEQREQLLDQIDEINTALEAVDGVRSELSNVKKVKPAHPTDVQLASEEAKWTVLLNSQQEHLEALRDSLAMRRDEREELDRVYRSERDGWQKQLAGLLSEQRAASDALANMRVTDYTIFLEMLRKHLVPKRPKAPPISVHPRVSRRHKALEVAHPSHPPAAPMPPSTPRRLLVRPSRLSTTMVATRQPLELLSEAILALLPELCATLPLPQSVHSGELVGDAGTPSSSMDSQNRAEWASIGVGETADGQPLGQAREVFTKDVGNEASLFVQPTELAVGAMITSRREAYRGGGVPAPVGDGHHAESVALDRCDELERPMTAVPGSSRSHSPKRYERPGSGRNSMSSVECSDDDTRNSVERAPGGSDKSSTESSEHASLQSGGTFEGCNDEQELTPSSEADTSDEVFDGREFNQEDQGHGEQRHNSHKLAADKDAVLNPEKDSKSPAQRPIVSGTWKQPRSARAFSSTSQSSASIAGTLVSTPRLQVVEAVNSLTSKKGAEVGGASTGHELVGLGGVEAVGALLRALTSFTDEFINLVTGLDAEHLTPSARRVVEPIISDPNMSAAALKPHSIVAAGLCEWIRAVYAVARWSNESQMGWAAVLSAKKDLDAAIAAHDELAEDIEQELRREAMLYRQLETATNAREALEQQREEREQNIAKLTELIALAESPPPGRQERHEALFSQANQREGRPLTLVNAWVQRRSIVEFELVQVPGVALLRAAASLFNGRLPADEQYMQLVGVLQEYGTASLPMPTSLKSALTPGLTTTKAIASVAPGDGARESLRAFIEVCRLSLDSDQRRDELVRKLAQIRQGL